MPQLFGSGVQAPAWSPNNVPILAIAAHVPASTSGNFGFAGASEGVLIVNIDVVSDGGHTGGAMFFAPGLTSFWFWVINIGSNSDSFSWRGMLPLTVISYQNSSDTGVNVVASGYRFPPG